MWPDRVSNPGPLTYESGALPTALCGPALKHVREREELMFKGYCIAFQMDSDRGLLLENAFASSWLKFYS